MLSSRAMGPSEVGVVTVGLSVLVALAAISGLWAQFLAIAVGLSLAGALATVWRQRKLISALDNEVLRLTCVAKSGHKTGSQTAAESFLAAEPALRDVLGVQSATLFAVDDELTAMVPIESFGNDETATTVGLDEDTLVKLDAGDAITIHPSARSSLTGQLLRGQADTAITLVPIIGLKRILGALCLFHSADRVFRHEDMNRLHGYSSNIGELWYRARLLDRLAKKDDELLDPLTRSGRTQRLETLSILGESARSEDPLVTAVVDSIADGVILTDVFGTVRLLNPTARRMLDVVDDESIGKSAIDLIGRRSRSSVDTLSQHFRRVVDAETLVDTEFKLADPTNRDYRLSLSPVRTVDGQIEGIVAVISDITKLKEMDQMKSDLMSMVTHEIRTPLATVRGFAQILLKGGVDGKKSREFLEIVNRQSNRLVNLVNDFLDISRIESGRQAITKLSMNMERMIRLVISDLKPLADEKKMSLSYVGPEGDAPEVHADRNLMEQVLINLVSNSIKYSRSGSSAIVKMTYDPDRVTVTVEDNGLGIPKEAVPRVFEKFFRVRSDDRSDIIGTGLGLSLVKQIIECHGGTIDVSSSLGEGSRFSFSLPLDAPVDAETEPLPRVTHLALQD